VSEKRDLGYECMHTIPYRQKGEELGDTPKNCVEVVINTA